MQNFVLHGWQGFKANWVLNELKANEVIVETEAKTPRDFILLVKSGVITSIAQIPNEHRKMIETQFRLGKYRPETMELLTKIGMAI